VTPGHEADSPTTDASPGAAADVRRLILGGIAWKGASQVGIQLTRVAVAVVVARILAPDEYGIAGMALVFSGFVLIFSDLALGQALVQRLSLTEPDKATAFWTSIAAGATFALVGVALAAPIADFFGEPRLEAMVMVLSVTFVVSAAGTTQSALLVREMNFRALELREIAATLVGAAAAVAGALAGLGAWAIVSQQLAATATTTALVWAYSPWRPTATFSGASLRRFAGFSANMLGTQTLTQLRVATPNAVIGRALGAPALGVYTLAYNVILLPFNRVAVPISQVLFPAMARIQDDRERLAGYWLRSIRLLAALVMPALVGLIVVTPDFVAAVLGKDWEEAVPVIRLLAAVGLLQTLQFLNPIVLQTLDRTSLLFRWSILSFAVAIVALAVGVRWGIVGVAAAFAVSAAVTETAYAWLTARLLGIPPVRVVRDLAGVAQATAAMAIAATATRAALLEAGAGPATRLAGAALVGAVVYVGACLWRARPLVEELRGLRRPAPARP
jgi:O-antigen/teichoic acid export membrane protein